MTEIAANGVHASFAKPSALHDLSADDRCIRIWSMSLFCLVHGSTQNATGWDLGVPALKKFGHDSVRMDLPTNEPAASATRYAEVIAEAIPRDRNDVTVMAHSAGGLFLP